MKKKKIYYKDLDLIRVIACISVFLYHLNILKGGYLAVCVFFVLSGYFSFSSVQKREKFSLKEYYLNKLLKLYLPLLLVIFITISSLFFIPKINILSLKSEVTSIIFGYNNFWQISANLDYFARHINSPFMHLWYISILLQFDLIFPFIYLFLNKIEKKFNKLILCIITGTLSIIFLVYFYIISITHDLMFTYYNTFTRIFSIFFGIFIGLIYSYYGSLIPKKYNNKKNKNNLSDINYKILIPKKYQSKNIIFYIYIAILILLFIFIDSKSILFQISMIIVTLITCRLIDYGTINTEKSSSKFDKVVNFLSNISYEIYLVQYPVIFLFQYIKIETYFKIPIIIILTFIISYLIHIFINFKNKDKKILKYISGTFITLLTLFGIYQYIIMPDYTKDMKELEKQLAQNTEILKQKQQEYEIKMKQEEENWLETLKDLENSEEEIKNIVKNLPVVGVGDSVLLGAINELYNQFPNGYFDGETSRTAWQLPGILQSLKNRNILNNVVIINLGANGDCSLTCKKEIMQTLEDKLVFWLNVTNDFDVNVNETLNSLAQLYSNLYIIDWNLISKGHPEYFIADGIHLTGIGKQFYVKAIYDSIYQVYLNEFNAKKEEILKKYEEEINNKIIFYGNDILVGIFDYIEENFSNSKFNINKNFNYEKLKLELEKTKEEIKSKKLVFAFDNSINLSIEEYKNLISICENNKIYIISTNKDIINNLSNLNNENIIIIDFYKEIKQNSNYLMPDKIHLTEDGNIALSKVINDNIK